MNKNSYKDLELEESMGFERKNWIAERIAWVLLTLFVLAALIGVFGRGGISSAKAGSAEQGMEAEYERFLRYHTSDNITFLVENSAKDSTYQLHLGTEWLEKVKIERVVPQPESEIATKDGIEYTFRVSPGHSPLRLCFYFEPHKTGTATVSVTSSDGKSLSFSQFIYP